MIIKKLSHNLAIILIPDDYLTADFETGIKEKLF